MPNARRFVTRRGHSALALAAGRLLCGTSQLAIITPWLTHAPAQLPVTAAGSVIVLGILGTGIAHAVNYSLIRDAGATAASTVTYLIPFFSTVAGVLILGDALTWNEPVGGVVVIAGVAVSQGRLGRMARVWMGSRKAVIPS